MVKLISIVLTHFFQFNELKIKAIRLLTSLNHIYIYIYFYSVLIKGIVYFEINF